MDYEKAAVELSLEMLDELILKVTPDKVILKANELVHMAADMDKTGAEKFEWVVAQVKPMLEWFIVFVGDRLVQLLYNAMMGRVSAQIAASISSLESETEQ